MSAFSLDPADDKSRLLGTIKTGKFKGERIYVEKLSPEDPMYVLRQRVNLDKGRMEPNINTKIREITYINGQSGAGKSTLAAKIAKTFRKANKDKQICIFSGKNAMEDPAFVKLAPFLQIRLDRAMVEKPILLSDFQEGSLVIFDDIGTIKDKEIEAEVESLAMQIMEVARYKGINMIITSHVVTKNTPLYQLLKVELHNFVFFPSTGVGKPMKRFLEDVYCLAPKDIRAILKINEDEEFAWILLQKTTPKLIMNPHGVEMLKHFINRNDEEILAMKIAAKKIAAKSK